VNWIHEIKHDGFRMMVRRDAAGVRLLTRNGIDWTTRFPLIARKSRVARRNALLISELVMPATSSCSLPQWVPRLVER
jgi:ATP-dependent DNA ligase